jgi:hypothetical protein
MDSLNICWRGQTRSGKKEQLHAALKQLATLRGIPFSIQTRQFYTQGLGKSETGQISTTAEDDGNDDGGSEKDSFPYEFSLLHIGFDIARMSMQDKIYLKPILQRWGAGSQVLAGNQGRGSRILVFYHAHLFSTESYFLLHSLLENNYGDVSIWLTSELPVAERLSDYFIEIPVAFEKARKSLPNPSWYDIFQKLLKGWSEKPFPKLAETNEIRALLYELLMRNLRWTDCLHYILDIMLILPLQEEKRRKVLSILAEQEATAAGQTIPSYRIPLLWESLFVKIREAISMDAISMDSSDNAAEHSVSSEEMHSGGEDVVSNAAAKVVVRQSKPRRRKNDGATVASG